MKPITQSLIAVSTFLLLLASAYAAPTAPTPLPPAAQEALDKGIIAAKVPDYLLAIRYFEEARKLAPDAPIVYLNMGLAESRIPGQELRAMAWFGAYLAAYPDAPNVAAVKEQIAVLEVRNQSNISRLIKSVQDAANQIPDNKESVYYLQQAVARSSHYLRRVAELWVKAGDIAAAVAIANLVQGVTMRGYAQLAITDAQIKMGDIMGAQKTAATIQNVYAKAASLRIIADGQIKVGDIAGAQRNLSSALKNADLIESATDKGSLQGTIATTQAKSGDIAGALKTADLIQTSGKDMALHNTISYQAESGDIAGAQKTVDGIQSVVSRIQAQCRIAEGQAKIGDTVGAQLTIVGAQKAADLIQDANSKNAARHAITLSQARSGDIAGAQKTADGIQNDSGFKSEAQLRIAESQAKNGDIAGAQRTAELIQKAYYKVLAQAAIAEAQAKSGDNAGAQERLASAQTAADLVQGEYYKENAQHVVAKARAHLGLDLVSDWLKKLDDDNKSNDCPLNTGPFLNLAGYLKSLPASGDPQKIFDALRETADKIVSAQNIITGMLKQQAKK